MKGRKKYEYRKSFSTYLSEEDNKGVSCVTIVKYNIRSQCVHTYSMIIQNGKYAPIRRLDKNKHKNIYGKIPVSDDEVVNKLKELIKDNWCIGLKGIKEKTGFSKYKISKMYMKAKREVGRRQIKNQIENEHG